MQEHVDLDALDEAGRFLTNKPEPQRFAMMFRCPVCGHAMTDKKKKLKEVITNVFVHRGCVVAFFNQARQRVDEHRSQRAGDGEEGG